MFSLLFLVARVVVNVNQGAKQQSSVCGVDGALDLLAFRHKYVALAIVVLVNQLNSSNLTVLFELVLQCLAQMCFLSFLWQVQNPQ